MQYDPDNIFAKIIAGIIPAERVYEDEVLIAIKDVVPAAPVHILVIPKKAYTDYSDFVTHALPEEFKHYFTQVAAIAEQTGLAADGYRLVTNKGALSGQSIFHFHTHILAGKQLGKLA